jgi:hypothetical protein
MATAWQTLEEAALTLGISSRTLHRRLSKGEFQTRLESGRREVLVTIADPLVSDDIARSATDTRPTPSTEPDLIGAGSTELSADVQSTMLMLHEDRIRRTDLAIMAYQQSVNVSAMNARRSAVSSRVAWGTAGGLAAILFVAVTWATHRVTKADADVQNLNGQLKQVSSSKDLQAQEFDRLRLNVEIARVASARAEGELVAAKTQIDQLSHEAESAKAEAAKLQQAAAVKAADITKPSTQPAATQPVSIAH